MYRISLTLVKRESLDHSGVGSENPPSVLEQLREAEDESVGSPTQGGFMRSFRTFSTGQLELRRLKAPRRLQTEPKAKEGGSPEDPDRPEGGLSSETPQTAETGGGRRRLLKARSVEDRSSGGRAPGPSTTTAGLLETPPLKPGPLRRSFSFRHWSGAELLRLRGLAKDKHQSDPGAAESTPPAPGPTRQKSRTLEVGAVLNRTDSLTEPTRKNRTLDNSDLLRLKAEGGDTAGGGALLRGGGGRSSERRLARFFSGIFSRGGSPSTGRTLQHYRGAGPVQSSTESMNGGDGKCTPEHTQGGSGSSDPICEAEQTMLVRDSIVKLTCYVATAEAS